MCAAPPRCPHRAFIAPAAILLRSIYPRFIAASNPGILVSVTARSRPEAAPHDHGVSADFFLRSRLPTTVGTA
eukprot:365698-Chlamydomonas_euryale.AAC.7